MLGPVIEGSRIRLEPPRPQHAPTFQRWFADTEVTRYLAHRHPPSARQEEVFWVGEILRDEWDTRQENTR